MIFEIERKLENKVFSSTVKFKAFGGQDIDEQEEKELVNDFGAPVVDLGQINFSSKYKVEDGKLVVDEVDGEEVSFVLNSRKVKVDNTLLVSYTIDAKREQAQTVLNTPALVSEAKCLIFEKKLREALLEKIEELKSKSTTFERTAPIEFTL